MCMALVLFTEMCRTAAYSNLHKYHMLGLHVTDKCLEQFIGTLVVSQSVKQCITVDLFPHILANVVDIQVVHPSFCCIHHNAVLN